MFLKLVIQSGELNEVPRVQIFGQKALWQGAAEITQLYATRQQQSVLIAAAAIGYRELDTIYYYKWCYALSWII